MKKYILISVYLLAFFNLFSQSPYYIFHTAGERQGLVGNYCYSILKDSRGYIWVGTHTGLSRYDGNHFYNYKAGKDSTTFNNSIILDLCEDKDGNIWGGTGSGIFCYSYKTNSFINYTPPIYDFVRGSLNIICDKNGTIWATSAWNVVQFNPKKNKFEELQPLTANKDSLTNYGIKQNGLLEDPSGKGIWLATRSGLFFYNAAEKKYYSYKNSPGDPLFTNHSVAALSKAPGGYFWFFDNVTKELVAFDPITHKILRKIYAGSFIPGALGQTIFEDSNNRVWFSTWNYKMAVVEYQKNIFTLLEYKDDNPLSIGGDNFWAAWEDEDKNVWLGNAGGISRCNYSKTVYSIVPIISNVPEFKNNRLGSFSIDPRDNSWWLASEEDEISIIHYYPETGKYRHFSFSKAIKNSEGQLPGPVYNVRFIDDQPYANTHTGVWRIDEKTAIMRPFEKKFNGLPFIQFLGFINGGNDIWFITKQGYIRWNRKTDKAALIKNPVDSLPDSQRTGYSQIFIDSKNNRWVIPAYGWIGYINDSNQVVMKSYIKNKAKELAGYITSITEDKKGNLWMAGNGIGLYKYNIQKEEMTLFDESDGITAYIGQATTDNEERIWLAAKNKFSIFNPATGGIRYYNLPVYENTLNYANMMHIDQNGSIVSTMHSDVVRFMPERLSMKPAMREPLLSMIKISGKDKLITDEKELKLEPNENSLEFSFGSLINNEIFPYSFEYRLDGFDEQWMTAGSSAMALYNNLNPGSYSFRVRAISKDKSWQTPERIINLTIRTPFYKASWFWILIGGLLIITLIFFYRFRMQKQKQILTLKTKAQQLEKEKTIVMYESLKQQLNPHFLFNSLTSLSGLIETDQQVAGDFLEQMSGIYRYILKNGDNETVSLKDEIEFVQLYINLQQTRFKKGLRVTIDVPDEYLHYKIAPVTLQNLIENAIKHNIIDPASPLVIDIFIDSDYLVVKNNLQKKGVVETSNKKGLAQFASLYRYMSDLPVVIEETETDFQIKIPLI